MTRRIEQYTTYILLAIIAGLSNTAGSNQLSSLTVTADNQIIEAYLNGEPLEFSNGSNWTMAAQLSNLPLNPAKNVLAFRIRDVGGPASFIANMRIGDFNFGTSSNWRVTNTTPSTSWKSTSFSDAHWEFATSHGYYGKTPWKNNVNGLALDTPAQWIWSKNNNAANEADNEAWLRFTFSGQSVLSETNRVSQQIINKGYYSNTLVYNRGLACPPGMVMTKVRVAHDWVVNGLSFYCGTLSADGSISNETRQNNFANSNYPTWIGSSRGSQQTLQCGTGNFITGFNARVGAYVDQLGLQCSSWETALDQASAAASSPAAVGGNGGTSTSKKCPAGYAVSSLRLHLTNPNAQSYVSHFAFDCRSLVNPAGDFEVSETDKKTHLTSSDSSSNSQTVFDHSFSCPANMVVTNLEYKHGDRSINSDDVQAVAFYCGHLLADGSVINSIRQNQLPNTNNPEWFGINTPNNAYTQRLCDAGNFVTRLLVGVEPNIRSLSTSCSTLQMALVGESVNSRRSSHIPYIAPVVVDDPADNNSGENSSDNDSDNNLIIPVDGSCRGCPNDGWLYDDAIQSWRPGFDYDRDFFKFDPIVQNIQGTHDKLELSLPSRMNQMIRGLSRDLSKIQGHSNKAYTIQSAKTFLYQPQLAKTVNRYIGVSCSEGYALTGSRIKMTNNGQLIRDIEWVCSWVHPHTPIDNDQYNQFVTFGSLLNQISLDTDNQAYQLNLSELLREEVQEDALINSLPIANVRVLEHAYGTLLDTNGVESTYLDQLTVSLDIEIAGETLNAVLALIEDDEYRKHLVLLTGLTDLTWGDIIPALTQFDAGQHVFPTSLVTWVLTSNGGVTRPASFSRKEEQLGNMLHMVYSHLYQSEHYSLELLSGINVAASLELSKLPNSLENSFGFNWDQHQVILEGEVNIELAEFLQGDWSSPDSVFFKATLPFTDFDANQHPFPADISQVTLESVSLAIGATNDQVSMTLSSIVDAKIQGDDHRFQFSGGTIYADNKADFTFNAQMLNPWNKPFGYNNVVLEQGRIFFHTDASFAQKQARFTGSLSVDNTFYGAGIHFETIGNQSSAGLQLSVEHLNSNKLTRLLSHFGATGNWQLPDDFELTHATVSLDGDSRGQFTAVVSGDLTIHEQLSVNASFEFTHSNSVGNQADISLGVTNLTSDEVASLLSYLSKRDWRSTIPRELFNIETLTLKMTLGNNSSLVANAYTEFCLFASEDIACEQSFVTSAQFSIVNNNTTVSLSGELQGQILVPLIDVPLQNPSISLIAENGYQDIDIRSTIIFNGTSVPIELEFESRNGDIQEKFIIGPIETFQIDDLATLFKEASFNNPLSDYEKHNISVQLTDTTLELEKENDLYRLTAFSSALIDHNTATDIELDALISATKQGSNPFNVFVALHETEIKKDTQSDDLSFASFAPALSNHSSDPGQNHGITLNAIKFEKSALVFSNSEIDLIGLSQQAQDFLTAHFDDRAFPIPNGIHFMADLVLEQPSLNTFNDQTERFGFDNTQSIFVEVGIDFAKDDTPEFSLEGIFPVIKNCDYFPNGCINGLPKWLVQTELALFIDVKRSGLDIGLKGGLGFSVHDDIMNLVLKGEFDAAPKRVALDFCAELGVFDSNNPRFPSCSLPIGDSCGKNSNGQWQRLFGQDWLEFQDILFGMSFSPLAITLDAAAGVRIDGKEMLLREFELSINPETGIPKDFVIDVLSNSTFSTQDFVELSSRFASHSGMPHFLADSSKLPALYLRPEFDKECGQDLLALKVDLRAGRFPTLKAEGELAFSINGSEQNAKRLGELQFEMDSHHLHFYGDFELGGKKLSETRLDLDSTGLNFASQMELPFVGEFVQVTKGIAQCDFTIAKHGSACFNNIVSQEATNVYNCGVEELSGLAQCATHPSNLYWTGWGPFKTPHCRTIKSCNANVNMTECRDDYKEAVRECNDYLTIDESNKLSLLAKVEAVIAVNGTKSEVKGSAEGDVCLGSTCYYARGDLDVGLDPRHFKVNFGKVGVVKELDNDFEFPSESEMKKNYPFVNQNVSYRGNLIDFDGSGEGDAVVIRDNDQSETTQYNNLDVLFSSRAAPTRLISGSANIPGIENDTDILSADRVQYADFSGDGQTDVLVEYLDTNNNYRWLVADNGTEAWKDITPDSIQPKGLQGEYAIIKVAEQQTSSLLKVKGVIAGDFDGDAVAEVMVITTTLSGSNRWYQCETGLAGECVLVYSSNKSYEYQQLQLGYLNNDLRVDLFYNESGTNNNGRWIALLSQEENELKRSTLKSNTFSDLKQNASASSILNASPGAYDRDISRGLHLGDFDGDGLTDVLTARTQDSNGQWIWTVAYANNDYNKVEVYRDWNNPDRLFVSDIDGNGLADAVIAQDNEGDSDYIWRVFYGGDNNTSSNGRAGNGRSKNNTTQNDALDTLITSINISTDLVHSGAISAPKALNEANKQERK